MIDINSDSFSLDIYVLKTCIEEISGIIPDKREYFRTLTEQRLKKCNEVYIKESNDTLDQFFNRISSNEYTRQEDFLIIKHAVKSINNSLKIVYKNMIKVLKTM